MTLSRTLTLITRESAHQCGPSDCSHTSGIRPFRPCTLGCHQQRIHSINRLYGEPAQDHETFGGTPDYSSIGQLNERTTGPADDLESLGYAWLCMLRRGHLPWNCNKHFRISGSLYTPGAACSVCRHLAAHHA